MSVLFPVALMKLGKLPKAFKPVSVSSIGPAKPTILSNGDCSCNAEAADWKGK